MTTAASRALRTAPVSVVVLASRPDALPRCLASLAACEPRPEETFVVLNGPAAARLSEAAGWADRLPGLRVLALPPSPLGRARNAALRAARGEAVCFLDDDARVPPDFFARLERKLREYPAADALGGPNLTPPESGRFARLAGALLGSPFGAGPMSRRYRGLPRDAWTDDSALMLCNLALRRRAVAAGAAFDEGLTRNEENLLLARLARRGGRVLHSPELFVWHERRPGLRAFLRQCFESGVGRAQMTRLAPGTLRPRHLAPLALGLASALAPQALAVYAAAAAAAAWRASRGETGRLAAAFVLWPLFPAAHAAYGAGLAAGAVLPRR